MILMEIKLNKIDVLFSSVFLTILQIFVLEFTLIRDQGWINVGAYDPWRRCFNFVTGCIENLSGSPRHSLVTSHLVIVLSRINHYAVCLSYDSNSEWFLFALFYQAGLPWRVESLLLNQRNKNNITGILHWPIERTSYYSGNWMIANCLTQLNENLLKCSCCSGQLEYSAITKNFDDKPLFR